jgi:hypothetical protein
MKDDDVSNALSDIFPEEVLELLRKLVSDKDLKIYDEKIYKIGELIDIISNSNPTLKKRIQKKIGFPLVDLVVSKLSSPENINQNKNIFTEQEMDKIKNAFYKSYPGLSKNELNKRRTLLQLSIYLIDQFFSFGPHLFPELDSYWNDLSTLDWKIITDLFSSMEKIKTHLTAFKGETIGLVYAREILSSLSEIKEIFHNLRFKSIKNRKDVVNNLLIPYQKLASYYEKVSKFALIDMRIVEGRYNPNRNYMGFLIHDISSSFLSSENYKALGEVNITVRNSIAHSSYIINENTHKVRFIDRHTQEEHGYEELTTMTKKLGLLLYVIMGHPSRGYSLEFQLLSDMISKKENQSQPQF